MNIRHRVAFAVVAAILMAPARAEIEMPEFRGKTRPHTRLTGGEVWPVVLGTLNREGINLDNYDRGTLTFDGPPHSPLWVFDFRGKWQVYPSSVRIAVVDKTGEVMVVKSINPPPTD